jgi:hypothetical protein
MKIQRRSVRDQIVHFGPWILQSPYIAGRPRKLQFGGSRSASRACGLLLFLTGPITRRATEDNTVLHSLPAYIAHLLSPDANSMDFVAFA